MGFNQRTSGNLLPFTSAAVLTAGQMAVVNDTFGIVAADLAIGDAGNLALEGTFGPLACLSTDVIAVGADLYYDAGNTRLTLTKSTHKYAGKAASVSGSGLATVDLRVVQAEAP